MTSFAASSLRFLRRLLHAQAAAAPQLGPQAVLDGLSAVAATEARLSDTAALGATYPGACAGRAWSRQQAQTGLNQFGEALGGIDAESPRGALAAAIGASMSGQRATVFLSGPDLAASTDLVALAAGQHVPLVLHLAARAITTHAQALGSGHEAYHAAADAGAFALFAVNVQEAVDLALIGRWVAERALVPGVVAMDAEQTALAVQEVGLPDEQMIRGFIGEGHGRIEAPTDAQRFIFGDTRRLVPRLYDLERPMMLSPLQGPESWALGAAGREPYFDQHLPMLLNEAFGEFAERTGRRYGRAYEHRLDGAEIVLVAQGAAVETAAAVADHARAKGAAVGVLGLRCLRPLPSETIALALKGAKTVAVLERASAPGGDGVLLREVRGVLDRARENARFGAATHPGCPPIADRDLPRLVGVPYGLGGLPFRAADLLALVRELKALRRCRVYLGLDFAIKHSDFPKHQALMDALRRAQPDLETLGLRTTDPPPEILPQDAVTVALHRLAGQEHQALAGEAAALIHGAFGGRVRSRPALTWQRFDEPCADYITHAPGPLLDPGDDAPVDIAVLAADTPHGLMDPTTRLKPDGTLLVTSEMAEVLPRRRLGPRSLWVVPGAAGEEALLGGLLALVAKRTGRELGTGKARSLREESLTEIPEPQREERLDAFAAAFDAVQELAAPESEPGAPDPLADIAPPALVAGLGKADDTVGSLPRFWDHTGVFYRTGRTDQLAADPCSAVGAIPPLSATFRDVSGGRGVLPVLDPQTCDGTRELWTTCPDGSVGVSVLSARALLDAGIDLATRAGTPADALRQVAGKLATGVNKLIASSDEPPATAGELFQTAFEALLEKMDAPADRKASLIEALGAVVGQIGDLPVARTRIFFDEPEAQARGSGELFVLVVNPDTCKSPELILAACEGKGLQAVPQTAETLQSARRLWNLWQRLPDTPGEAIERARKHPDLGLLAALLLSRHCLHAMVGGDGAEAASGAKAALARVLGVAEFHRQPRLQKHLQEIETLRSKLAERIREVLAEALPADDLDALAQGLDLLGRSDVDLATLSEKVDTAMTAGRVEGARLGRLVDVARGLADLSWRLAKGPDGLGRARVGLAVCGSVASWAGAYPYNAFGDPVVIDATGDVGRLARGLLEGQLAQAIAGVRLMRWARMELENPNEAAHAARALAALRYEDLTADERDLCPPVLVVGDDQTLGSGGLSQLTWVLSCGLPVKVIVLSDIGTAADSGLRVDAFGSFPAGGRFDLALLALLTRTAYVVQTSLAEGDHLAQGMLSAMGHDGPALVVIHAPSPQRHGFAPQRLYEQARLAVASRALPLLTFDPGAEGVFGACMDLDANPDCTERLAGGLTPVDWAATEDRFSEHVAPLADDDAGATPIAEYLDLTPAERTGKTPFVVVDDQRLRVAPPLVADADQRLAFWRTLQELAGVVTPFTKKARQAAERDVAATHEAEIARLKQEYEARIAALKGEFQAEATDRVTERLMALAGRRADGGPNGEGDA
ncbi:MAG: transketolase C-terminal domain-containing protein [Planctomycetota bacterium]